LLKLTNALADYAGRRQLIQVCVAEAVVACAQSATPADMANC
jgi:hypothetical protein